MLTRHLAAAFVILAIALGGPVVLPGKTKMATIDQPAADQISIPDAANS